MGKLNEVSEEQLPFFLKKNTGLGEIRPEDELLHPESFKNVADDSATETQYFGFSVPEENIHGLTYMWWHPNLKVCSGGLYVWQGVKQRFLDAELCDWRTFMSDKAIANDLHEFRFDNGYGVKILEPNKRFHLTYDAPAQNNSVDIVAEAVLPGVMFGDGLHFEQTMRMKGRLVLRGKEYAVDCWSIRDRSWGKPRPEEHMPMPPMSWMCATFSETFSFNCTMFDQAKYNPTIKPHLAMPDDKVLNSGWVWRDGKLGQIVAGEKRLARGPGQTIPSNIHLWFKDEHDREFDVHGSLLASCPIQPWNNTWMVINLFQWECDGMSGHGDVQEGFWCDYLHSRGRV